MTQEYDWTNGFANFTLKPKVKPRVYRKGSKRAGIYYLLCNDKMYIGESTDIPRRVQEHIDEIAEGCHRMDLLDEFGILLEMPNSTWEQRLKEEKYFCLLLKNYYNIVSKPHVCAK